MDQLPMSCPLVLNVAAQVAQRILLTGVNYRGAFLALNHEVINKYYTAEEKNIGTNGFGQYQRRNSSV